MSSCEPQVMETPKLPEIERPETICSAIKKILVVSNTNEFGGAEKHTLDLIQRLQGPGIQISILCFSEDFFSERLESGYQGVRVIKVNQEPHTLGDWIKFFRAYNADVLVLVYGWLWSLPSIVAASAWLAGIRKRVAIQHLISPALDLPPLLKELWKKRTSFRGRLSRLLGRETPWVTDRINEVPVSARASLSGPKNLKMSAYACKTTICVSNALRESLKKDFGFPAWKMRTIHNGTSLSSFFPSETVEGRVRAKLGIRSDEFLLVYIGRLSEQKGIDILLLAVSKTIAGGIPCKCILVGDGPLKQDLLEQAQTLGLSGHVFFEGFQDDIRPYLHAASAFILTSHREGLPLSIIEAMACGLASIVTDVGGNAEAITDHVHGLVIPPNSAGAAAAAIVYLATHPEERGQMATRAREKACAAFDIEKGMSEIKRVILN